MEFAIEADTYELCIRLQKTPDEIRAMTAADFDALRHYYKWREKR